MPQTDYDRERKFQIQLRMQIPDSCSEGTLHKSLKKKLVSSFSNTPLFHKLSKYSQTWNTDVDFGRQTG